MPEPPVPAWLRGLPRAPEYRPTESEFADPIAFLSRVEREAAAFGICKVIPPYHRPSRRYVFAHLNRSLLSSPSTNPNPNPAASSDSSPNPTPSPSPAPAALFTTRHQELGTARRGRPPPQVLKQVWQSGERYTLDQFEAKSRAFAKAHLAGLRDPTPLAVESLFWKASADRPIYIEYANDVPGSGFAASAQSHRRPHKKRRREGAPNSVDEGEKATGWKLSCSPWNLQAIARAPGSLTRFMPDDVPGVTSPMVYIGMLFSWFAWHIEDHELHSLNFLHTGAPKTWYAVPGDRAAELEEVIRVHGYGGNPDRLASLAVLGEKTTLMSPEVIVASGLPCCRLVQHPGEFVVTFPRAYHVGFSHGFNCGEAANFATPQWLKFAKEAAVRRAVMNYLPMLSHQQLLYLLAVSFISRTPRELLYGIRTSRLRDRRKEERELLVKREFLQDMISENELLCSFLKKKLIDNAVLWEPDLLPSSTALHSCSSGPKAPLKVDDVHSIESVPKENSSSDDIASRAGVQPKCMSMDSKSSDAMSTSEAQKLDTDTDDDGDLPFDLSIDSGSLTCVACGILGFPFMAILQPSKKALEDMSLVDVERFKLNCEKENHSNAISCSPDDGNSGHPVIAKRPSSPVAESNFSHQNAESDKDGVGLDGPLPPHNNSSHSCSSENTLNPCINTETTETKIPSARFGIEFSKQTGRGDIDAQATESCGNTVDWNISSAFVRPRIFCLQHALEIEELLEGKGGVHALIICHADYTKLKALAISIAEEIEFQFDCKDVPLANASKSDLHLINISIDDEGYKEDERDWTTQMGLNMKYFAKLRKETPGCQEQPPLSFWKRLDISDKPSPISVVPNLKWLCRRARTPYRVVGYAASRNATVGPDVVSPAVTKAEMGTSGNAYENAKEQQTAEQDAPLEPSRLQEADDVADMHTCSEDIDQDMHCLIGSKRQRTAEQDAPLQPSGLQEADDVVDMHTCSVDNDQAMHRLIGIPVAVAEYPMMHQVCEGTVSVSTCELDDLVSASTSDDSVCKAYSQDSPGVSDDFTAEQKSVQSDELTSSVAMSVQQFLVDESMIAEDSSNHENLGCYNVTSECKDKQLQVQQEQENIELCNNAGRNLATVVQVDSSHFRDKAVNLKSAIPTESQHEYPRRDAIVLEGMQAALTTVVSEENRNSVHTELDSLGILLGALAEESILADVPGKDEVDDASLTLMTLASIDQSAGDVAHNEVIETSSSSVGASLSCRGRTLTNLASDGSLRIQNAEIQNKQENAEEVGAWNCQGLKNSRGILDSSANSLSETGKSSGTPNTYQPDILSRSIGSSKRTSIICYVRRKRKQKRKRESQSVGSFARAPCERLRPRTKPAVIEEPAEQIETAKPSAAATKGKRSKVVELFQCEIDFCDMTFESKADLRAHERNICTDESCGKRFQSHKYLKRHQCVHRDERPFKCPWEGCGMTFKWLWAQTEHIRVHTGERPYECSVVDCGQTFRYVSDYSRHRRKFNHY
ncbi:probable lysine-specific demethylase SE14 [Aegilops tauschii subsp. strangulata]|uniref:Lysine-specific demethylase ELF6 n=3 Tax=Aegilops tauschii subsp. strangulata TaxID=200361 RepID=A0A453J0E9_AEGTS|nr:lysine-specific demethylase SE14 [Aegilops tauschii subsp. strangulata]